MVIRVSGQQLIYPGATFAGGGPAPTYSLISLKCQPPRSPDITSQFYCPPTPTMSNEDEGDDDNVRWFVVRGVEHRGA